MKIAAKRTTGKQRRKGEQASNEPDTSKSSLPPTKKRKSKVMNQKERDMLLASLSSIDFSVLQSEVLCQI